MIAGALDGILGLAVLEGVGLTLFHARTGRGVAPRLLWPNLAAGILLLLGVRLALGVDTASRGHEVALLAVLAAAGVAHCADVAGRWRR